MTPGIDMDGTTELRQLTDLLRVGLTTVREIARYRLSDYDKLMDIAARSEAMADELDTITGDPVPPETPFR